MIATLVVAVLACGALAYVAAPIRSRLDPSLDPSFELDELQGKKRAALTAIIDIESERDVGKLSGEDFAILRSEYEAEAMDALVRLDALRAPGGEEDADLEAEIAAIRRRLAESGRPESLACPSCGAARAPGGPCERCGA